LARSSGPLPGSTVLSGVSETVLVSSSSAQLTITGDDYNAFVGLLTDVQAGYSKGDLAKILGLATRETLGYSSKDHSRNGRAVSILKDSAWVPSHLSAQGR
jgi:hypothetical protein